MIAQTKKSLRGNIQVYLTLAIIGREVTDLEHELFALPTRLGGLAIKDPVQMAENAYDKSKKAVEKLVNSINNHEPLNSEEHRSHLKKYFTRK